MKKAVYHGIRDIRLEEVEEPKPGPKEAKIKVKYCGICGSDLHEYLHGPFRESRFGHEACGEIVEIGSNLKGFKIGDRVLALDKGAYAEYTLCPDNQLYIIPDSMSWEQAALIEPLAVAAYTIKRGGVEPGDTVLIAGAGPIGLVLLIGLKAIGVKTVYISDISEERRKKAEELGATLVINPLNNRISAAIKELTQGEGVDVAIEAVGMEATLKDCLTSVRTCGKVIVAGMFTERMPINMFSFVVRETTMIGANSTDPVLALDWVRSKGVKPEVLITKIIPLEEVASQGFEVLSGKNKAEVKILVKP